MLQLQEYLATLRRLDLSLEAKAMLQQIDGRGEADIHHFLSMHLDQDMHSIDLTVVRQLHERARTEAYRSDLLVFRVEQFWLLARISEFIASANHRPFCKYCYRTVAIRRNGRLKELCPEHASDSDAGNRGGYLRGYRFSDEFQRKVEDAEVFNTIQDVEFQFLRHQLNSVRKGAGSARNVVMPISATDKIWTDETHLNIEELRLPEICLDYPDWTELARRWRHLFGDSEGFHQLESQKLAVTPGLLLEQWFRWKIWTTSGDKEARVGKGRPAKIDKELAVEMRARGATHAEIADHFDVSKVAVAMFFTRLKKRVE